MTQLEFEIERDNIELSYGEKIAEHETQLSELKMQKADIVMQQNGIEKEIIRLQTLIDMLKRTCQEDLLKLKREFLSKQE